MKPAHQPQLVPPSGASEPSEPSSLKPENKPREQLTGRQEENPQVVAHRPQGQAGDTNNGGRGAVSDVKERVDERKRRDVAGGFGGPGKDKDWSKL